MIRCTSCHQVIPRYPCQRCRTDKRDPRIAKAVIARDKRCVYCGTTERLEAGHKRGYDKAITARDSLDTMEAQCFAYNRTGRCKTR